ncbi:29007_t:CDS:2, partial [Racocetra persica]
RIRIRSPTFNVYLARQNNATRFSKNVEALYLTILPLSSDRIKSKIWKTGRFYPGLVPGKPTQLLSLERGGTWGEDAHYGQVSALYFGGVDDGDFPPNRGYLNPNNSDRRMLTLRDSDGEPIHRSLNVSTSYNTSSYDIITPNYGELIHKHETSKSQEISSYNSDAFIDNNILTSYENSSYDITTSNYDEEPILYNLFEDNSKDEDHKHISEFT